VTILAGFTPFINEYIFYIVILRGRCINMKELINLWIEQVNQKQALRKMIKGSSFSFQLRIGKKEILIKIDNGAIYLEEYSQLKAHLKKLEGKEELILSIILGERKLRDAVKNNEITTTFSLREQLLLESLFFLGKPMLLKKISAKIY